MPLSKKQVNDETLLEYLDEFEALPEEQRVLEQVIIVDEQGEAQLIAAGFTVTVVQQDRYPEKGAERSHEWAERRFVVLSPEYAKKQQEQLEKQIAKCAFFVENALVFN